MTAKTHRTLLALVLASVACAADGDVLQDDGASGGMADECTGLERDACMGNCTAIWGTPYQLSPNGEWCLFSNGLEFLGCREASSCGQQTGSSNTLCSGGDTWRTQTECIPAELDAEVCQPPVPDAPFC